MIPAGKYDPKRASDLLWYLIQEVRRTQSDRSPLEQKWIQWEQIYRARPLEEQKNFPFENASNLVIPVAATDIDTLYSRMMGLLFDPPNLWSISAQRPEYIDLATATEDFLEWAQHNELNLHGPIGDWLVEMHKLGTGVLKQRYTREMKKVYEWRELEGRTWEQQAIILLKDRPAVHNVRLIDFYIPPGFRTEQEAPWVAERIYLTWQQYMNRVKAGLYQGSDAVGSYFFAPPLNPLRQELNNIALYPVSMNKQQEFFECWLDYDIDGDGWDEALVCTIHLPSQTYIRLDFNPFFNQDKPYSSGRFMRDVNGYYGIGLCEMLDGFQEEITAMHNQRIDNGTVQNSQMFAVRKDNMQIKQNEKIYSGKIWRLNDPKTDLIPIAMGAEMAPISIEIEASTRSEAQRRTGVNDWISAQAGPATTYGTAYASQQMIQSSTLRFGETLREVRQALSETGTRILELYQQFNSRGKEFTAVGQKEGTLVSLVLHFPLDLIRRGLKVSVTAIDAANSKDARIRTTTLVMQGLTQFYSQYLTLLSYATNPQMPPPIRQTALQAAEGSGIMMRRLLELYGLHDSDRLVPELEGAANAQQAQLQQILATLGGPGGGTQGAAPASGMAGVQQPAGFGAGGPSPVGPPQQLGSGSAMPGAGGPGYA